MPVSKIYGLRPSILDSGQVWTLPAAKASSPPIQIDRWFRNGRAPDASMISAMSEGMNQALIHRTKEVFGVAGRLGAVEGIGIQSFGAGDRARFRFAFHTSPHSHALLCRVAMYPQTGGYEYDSYGRLDINSGTTESGLSIVATQEFHYGTNPLNTLFESSWQHIRYIDKFVTGLDPDTDYYGTFYDVDNGLIQSACIVDLQSLAANNGYLPQNFTSESKILDVNRENIASLIPGMWKRGGAKVLNWTVQDGTDPLTRSSSTPINIIDTISTTISSATPGYSLNMTGKARLSQSGVPVVMKVFGRLNNAGPGGRVYLKDSAGNTVMSIIDGWSSPTATWVSVAGTLPATTDKYDLQFSTNTGAGETFSLYAISIYEHET